MTKKCTKEVYNVFYISYTKHTEREVQSGTNHDYTLNCVATRHWKKKVQLSSNTYSYSREGSNFWARGYEYVLCIDNLCAAIFFSCSDLVFARYFSKPRYMHNLQ